MATNYPVQRAHLSHKIEIDIPEVKLLAKEGV
jgi:hypothetical protein